MKRAAIMRALIYGVIVLLLSYAVPIASFIGTEMKLDINAVYMEVFFWLGLLALIVSQFALLAIPVRAEMRRPVTKRTIILPILAASLMAGVLALGAVASAGEFLTRNATSRLVWRIAWTELGLVWLLWALIFSRWSRNAEPKGFVERMTRVLYTGSILELLIAVPTHIVVRHRTYCCAGLSTLIGISAGIAVMLFAFGPAVFFLYAARARKKKAVIVDVL